MLAATATGVFKMLAAMTAPCSVKAIGNVRRPPRPPFEVAICNFKAASSDSVRPQPRNERGRCAREEKGERGKERDGDGVLSTQQVTFVAIFKSEARQLIANSQDESNSMPA